jgi:DNA adenine methylase
MRYFGGKVRIAKQVADVINKNISESERFVDAFCGSCNIVSGIQGVERVANDAHKELITMWIALQNGWLPPEDVSEEDYHRIKEYGSDELKAFVGFGCSFSGKYWGGYARDGTSRNYAKNAANSLKCKLSKMLDVEFTSHNYLSIPVRTTDFVYCDIPYRGTTGYKGVAHPFNHEEFYNWAERLSSSGAKVLVSEYLENLPEGWGIVKVIPSKQDIRGKENTQAATTEILMSPSPDVFI